MNGERRVFVDVKDRWVIGISYNVKHQTPRFLASQCNVCREFGTHDVQVNRRNFDVAGKRNESHSMRM